MSGKPLDIPETVAVKLAEARVARLATIQPNGQPHVLPVCFVFDQGQFLTALDRKPKRVPPENLARVRNLQAHPEAALIIDHYSEDWNELWYVLVHGHADMIPPTASAEHGRAIQKLRAKYPQYSGSMLPAEALVIRITPERMTWWGKI